MRYLFWNFITVLHKFRTSSIINILGMSAAIAVFLVVVMQIGYDLNYDKHYRNSSNIFLLTKLNTLGYWGENTNQEFPEVIIREIPEITDHCLVSMHLKYDYDYVNERGEAQKVEIESAAASPGFLTVFTPEILYGNTVGLFTDPEKAMISEKNANRYFGSIDVLGKTLSFGDKTHVISAVYKDFPDNSRLHNGIYFYMEGADESQWRYYAYFMFDPADIDIVNHKLKSKVLPKENISNWFQYYDTDAELLRVAGLPDRYLYGDATGGRRINTVISLAAIGLLTLLIAFINFVNMSLAMKPSRVREINIRKVLGISPGILRTAVAMESVLFVAVSTVLALLALSYFRTTSLAYEFFATDLSLSDNLYLVAGVVSAILIVAVCVGLYSARYITSFNEAMALKGSFALSRKGARLRNTLITIQFLAATVLICVSLFIRIQHDYVRSYSWGLETENIIYATIWDEPEDRPAFEQELLRDPRILEVTVAGNIPGYVGMSWGRDFEGRKLNAFAAWPVEPNFFDFFGIEIIAGEKPDPNYTTEMIYFNEAFMKANHLDESIIGKEFEIFETGVIGGIVKDVNFESLYNPIRPMAFVLLEGSDWKYNLMAKVTGQDIAEVARYIKTVSEDFVEDEVDVGILEDAINFYRRENSTAKMIGLFGIITVLISIMGIYGLVVFNTRYKVKEIGIRKVNGATAREILFLLNRNMMILLGVAFLIAIPISLTIINRWVSIFSFRTGIPWWLFPAAGLALLAVSALAVSRRSWKAASANPADSIRNE